MRTYTLELRRGYAIRLERRYGKLQLVVLVDGQERGQFTWRGVEEIPEQKRLGAPTAVGTILLTEQQANWLRRREKELTDGK